jgi:hypothetical protein
VRPKSTSRGALLAGALGGIGTWAAGAIGRTSPVTAADGQTIVVGDEYTATSTTKLTSSLHGPVFEGVNTADGFGLRGEAVGGIGVSGSSSSSFGVFGFSSTGNGVRAISNSGDALWPLAPVLGALSTPRGGRTPWCSPRATTRPASLARARCRYMLAGGQPLLAPCAAHDPRFLLKASQRGCPRGPYRTRR